MTIAICHSPLGESTWCTKPSGHQGPHAMMLANGEEAYATVEQQLAALRAELEDYRDGAVQTYLHLVSLRTDVERLTGERDELQARLTNNVLTMDRQVRDALRALAVANADAEAARELVGRLGIRIGRLEENPYDDRDSEIVTEPPVVDAVLAAHALRADVERLMRERDPGLWPGLFRKMQAERDAANADAEAAVDFVDAIVQGDTLQGQRWQDEAREWLAAHRARAALAGEAEAPTPGDGALE